MSVLFQIPVAMMNSIWLMSILFALYVVLKYLFNFSPASSFLMAVGFEMLASLHFIYVVFNPSYSSFKITTIFIGNATHWIIPFIGIVYGIALFIYIIYLFNDFKQINRLRNNADYTSSNFWNHLLQKNGLENYQIGVSSELKAPITFGWMEAVILLPISVLNQLSVEEVKYIIFHEIAHINRNDFVVQLIIKFAHSILLFNPFSYFFLKEINIQRELACDAWVLERVNNPLAYSKSLYQLALVANQEQNEFILNAIGSEKEVLTRIKFLNKLPIQSTHLVKQLAFAFLVFFFSSIDFSSKILKQTSTLKQSNNNITAQVQDRKLLPNSSKAILKKDKLVFNKYKQSIEFTTLKPSIISISPVKEEEYTAMVSKAANWIKERENPYQFINYSSSRDSIEFEIAEKLMLRSLLQNYQLRKELLNAKLANIASEREAMDFLEHSKEWKEVLQYENWASTFLKRHPEVLAQDSLRRF